MNLRTLFVSAGLLAIVCGSVYSGPSSPLPTPEDLGPTRPPATIPPPSTPLPVIPKEKSVEELLDELERLQAQKAELEKKEQELKALVRKKLEKQAERLNKLGVAPQPAKEPEPDRVGRIVIQGFAAKDEKKVREALGIVPGQILQYPALKEAPRRLEKAGFSGATVEVIPNELDSHFKDIRVKSAAELDR